MRLSGQCLKTKGRLHEFNKLAKDASHVSICKAWQSYDQSVEKFRQVLKARGMPEEWNFPADYAERVTGRKRPLLSPSEERNKQRGPKEGDNKSSNGGSDASEEGSCAWTRLLLPLPQDRRTTRDVDIDDDDDSPGNLSKSAGANFPVFETGKVMGYRKQGASYKVIVRQGKEGAYRYRTQPSKSVPDFDVSASIHLPKQQLGSLLNEKDQPKYTASMISRIMAVSWEPRGAFGDNPLDAMNPDLVAHNEFPKTDVWIQWSDGKETWETRTSLRNRYPRSTADAIIYERAGRQEERYRRAEGLPPLTFKKRAMPSQVDGMNLPAFSISTSERGKTRNGGSKFTQRSARTAGSELDISSQSSAASERELIFLREQSLEQKNEIDNLKKKLDQLLRRMVSSQDDDEDEVT